MEREVVVVDRALCGGCGNCLGACPHEALQLVEGLARVVGEALCAACGACLEVCPHGALVIALRPAAPFDEAAAGRRVALRARMRALAEDAC